MSDLLANTSAKPADDVGTSTDHDHDDEAAIYHDPRVWQHSASSPPLSAIANGIKTVFSDDSITMSV